MILPVLSPEISNTQLELKQQLQNKNDPLELKIY